MKDFNVLSYVGRSLWAITEDKWAEMMPALIRHAKGDRLNAEQLQAFAGNDHAGSSRTGPIAIIPVRGVIANRMGSMDDTSGGTSCERISSMIKMAQSEGAETIVYAFDSPGGTVGGVQELAAQMFALRGSVKQIAQIDGMCCSAAYWLASQCDEIICTPSGEAGSIGVFAVHKDLSEALAKEGIKINVIKAGKFKTEGNPFEPLSEEAKAVMQANVDAAFGQFSKDVARGRGVNASDVKGGYGEGRSLPSKDAKAAGLVDRIATMDDTIGRLVGKSRSAVGGMRAESCELLPGIDGHAHAIDAGGFLTCGCEWPEEMAAIIAQAFAPMIEDDEDMERRLA